MVADLRRLVFSSASYSRNPIIKASSRVQGARGTSRSSASSSGDSSSSPPARPERLLLPAQVAGLAPRVVKVKWKRVSKRRNAPGSRGEDFIPWVPADTEGPQDLDEEEQEERMTRLLDRYVAHKRKWQVISISESDTAHVQTGGSSRPAADGQPAADGSSGDQAIIMPCSPELGPTCQTKLDRVGRSESNEDDSAPTALQVIPPSNQAEELQSRSKYMRSGLPRPHWPDQVITHSYLPPCGPEPSRVELSALGAKEVKDILHRWEPFHHGASLVDRLGNLYPHIYRVPVVARGTSLREDYTMTLLASTPKENFLQIIDYGIQVRNHNFVQSAELVR